MFLIPMYNNNPNFPATDPNVKNNSPMRRRQDPIIPAHSWAPDFALSNLFSGRQHRWHDRRLLLLVLGRGYGHLRLRRSRGLLLLLLLLLLRRRWRRRACVGPTATVREPRMRWSQEQRSGTAQAQAAHTPGILEQLQSGLLAPFGTAVLEPDLGAERVLVGCTMLLKSL